MKHPEDEGDQTVGVHDVIHPVAVLLPLEKALGETDCDEGGHHVVDDLYQVLNEYHGSPPINT